MAPEGGTQGYNNGAEICGRPGRAREGVLYLCVLHARYIL